MRKKRKIDFVLEDNEFYKIIFRFYPRLSSCHSFNDEPPKSYSDIYKVYYYYKIFKVWKDEDGYFHEILFDSSCDECSMIDEVAARLKYLSEGKKEVQITCGNETYTVKLLDNEIFTFADCTWWSIKDVSDVNYKFELFRYDNVGYRFWLSKEKAYEFGECLQECCDYMLAHGDPI